MHRVLSVRVSEGEYLAFMTVCDRNKVSRQDMLHSIIVDALTDEGFDGLRSDEPQRRETGPERSEGSGAAAEGDS